MFVVNRFGLHSERLGTPLGFVTCGVISGTVVIHCSSSFSHDVGASSHSMNDTSSDRDRSLLSSPSLLAVATAESVDS
jgi:hypothetical protein